MIVVADSSPFVVLVSIEHGDLFAAVFGEIIIPPQVRAELASPKRSDAVRAFIAAPPSWLHVVSHSSIEPIERLHAGELLDESSPDDSTLHLASLHGRRRRRRDAGNRFHAEDESARDQDVMVPPDRGHSPAFLKLIATAIKKNDKPQAMWSVQIHRLVTKAPRRHESER
jgi:hypothetical protein